MQLICEASLCHLGLNSTGCQLAVFYKSKVTKVTVRVNRHPSNNSFLLGAGLYSECKPLCVCIATDLQFLLIYHSWSAFYLKELPCYCQLDPSKPQSDSVLLPFRCYLDSQKSAWRWPWMFAHLFPVVDCIKGALICKISIVLPKKEAKTIKSSGKCVLWSPIK